MESREHDIEVTLARELARRQGEHETLKEALERIENHQQSTRDILVRIDNHLRELVKLRKADPRSSANGVNGFIFRNAPGASFGAGFFGILFYLIDRLSQ